MREINVDYERLEPLLQEWLFNTNYPMNPYNYEWVRKGFPFKFETSIIKFKV